MLNLYKIPPGTKAKYSDGEPKPWHFKYDGGMERKRKWIDDMEIYRARRENGST